MTPSYFTHEVEEPVEVFVYWIEVECEERSYGKTLLWRCQGRKPMDELLCLIDENVVRTNNVPGKLIHKVIDFYASRHGFLEP